MSPLSGRGAGHAVVGELSRSSPVVASVRTVTRTPGPQVPSSAYGHGSDLERGATVRSRELGFGDTQGSTMCEPYGVPQRQRVLTAVVLPLRPGSQLG